MSLTNAKLRGLVKEKKPEVCGIPPRPEINAALKSIFRIPPVTESTFSSNTALARGDALDNRERLQRLKSASRHRLHKKLSLRLNVCSETHVLFLHCAVCYWVCSVLII